MPKPRFRTLPNGDRAQIVSAGELRAGDVLAYRGRSATLWFPVAKIDPTSEKTVRVAIDDGGLLEGYSWNSRRRTTSVAIAPRRVYLAQVFVDEPGLPPDLLEESTRPDAAAAADWLREFLHNELERPRRPVRLRGTAAPGEWITDDYAAGDREFAFDEDPRADELVAFVAVGGAVTRIQGPRS